MATLESCRPVELHGPAGVGKSALLAHLAHDPAIPFPERVIQCSARRQPVADLLQTLFDRVYEVDAAVKPTDGELRRHLDAVEAVVLLDDVDQGRDELRRVMDAAPGCTLVLASRQPRLWGAGRSFPLGGLDQVAARAVVEHELGRPLTSAETGAADALSRALKGHPRSLLQATAFVREGLGPLTDFAEVVSASDSPTEELSKLILGSLGEPERRVLSVVAALDGAPLDAEHVAALTGLPDAHRILESLRRRHLVQAHSPRYSVTVAPGSALDAAIDPEPWRERLPDHLASWAERETPERVLEQSAAILGALDWAVGDGRWREALRLVRALDPALALTGRWGAWEATLQRGLRAARATGDRAAEAWALHQHGTRALCLDERATAASELGEALRIRESLGDDTGAAVTRHNLHLLGGPPPAPPQGPPKRPPTPSYTLPLAVAMLVLAVVGLAVFALGRGGGGSEVVNAVHLEPERLDLGSQPVGMPSSVKTVRVTNRHAERERIGSVAIEGPHAGDFEVTTDGCTATPLDPGASCVMGVRFTPSAAGGRSARLTMSGVAVALSGTGTPGPSAAYRVDPTQLDFGEERVGATSAERTVTLTNNGVAGLRIERVSIVGPNRGDFRAGPDRCGGVTLRPGAGCVVGIRFAPTATGGRTAALEFDHDGSDGSVAVALTGSGTPATAGAAPRVAPTRLDFGDQPVGTEGVTRAITITSGGAPLHVEGLSMKGHVSDFSVKSDRCRGATLGLGASCTVDVHFVPTATGDRSAVLAVDHDGSGGPLTVLLTGTGTETRQADPVRAEPSRLDFGDQPVGRASKPKTVTVTNDTATPVDILSLRVAGKDNMDFEAVTPDSCSAARLQPRGTCTVAVRFRPVVAGTRAASLTIRHSGSSEPATVVLTGTGTPEADLFVMTQLASQGPWTVEVTNNGPSPATSLRLELVGTNMKFSVSSSKEWQCVKVSDTQTGDTFECTFVGTLDSGAKAAVQVTVERMFCEPSVSATASAKEPDPDPSNNNHGAGSNYCPPTMTTSNAPM